MKEDDILEHLLNLARRLEFDVRFDQGSFRDGSCRLQDKKVIILNRFTPTVKKIAALSRALAEQPLDGIYLLPVIRETIDNVRKNEPQLSVEGYNE